MSPASVVFGHEEWQQAAKAKPAAALGRAKKAAVVQASHFVRFAFLPDSMNPQRDDDSDGEDESPFVPLTRDEREHINFSVC